MLGDVPVASGNSKLTKLNVMNKTQSPFKWVKAVCLILYKKSQFTKNRLFVVTAVVFCSVFSGRSLIMSYLYATSSFSVQRNRSE